MPGILALAGLPVTNPGEGNAEGAAKSLKFVVDLARVTLLVSIGIRLLVQAARGQQGRSGKLTIAGAQPAVKKALESAGIDKLIPLFDDVESARTAFA